MSPRRFGIRFQCLVLLLFLTVAGTRMLHAQEAGAKFALLVGVDKYSSGSGFASLRFPQHDVDQLADVLLKSGYGPQHVRVMTFEKGSRDTRFLPNLKNIMAEFKLLAGDRKPQDSLLIALVGHGLIRKVKDPQGKEVEKPTGFFCPMDADIEDTKSMISLDDFYAELEQSKAVVKVMLVDACRNNPTEGRSGGIPFAPPPAPASIAAIFSCSNGEVAWEDRELGGGHGVFFHYVIEGLKGKADQEGNHDGKIALTELVQYTQAKVPAYVAYKWGKRQRPMFQGLTGPVTLLDVPSPPPAPDVVTTQVAQIKPKLERGSPQGASIKRGDNFSGDQLASASIPMKDYSSMMKNYSSMMKNYSSMTLPGVGSRLADIAKGLQIEVAKHDFAAYRRGFAEAQAVVQTFVGTRVTWEAKVESIDRTSVKVKCGSSFPITGPSSGKRNSYLYLYVFYKLDEQSLNRYSFSDILHIGTNISADYAATLKPGSIITVSGTVARFFFRDKQSAVVALADVVESANSKLDAAPVQ